MQGKHYSFEIRKFPNTEVYYLQKFPLVENIPVRKERQTWILNKEDLAALKNTIKALLEPEIPAGIP